MSLRDDVRDCFPELAELDDDDLRSGVVEAWAIALEANGSPDLASLPWLGPYQAQLGLSDELLVDHIRDVAAVSVAIADALLDRRGATLDLDLDTVLAGALVHDVSQVGEVDGDEWTRVGRLLGHPHYGVYLVLAAGLPVEIAHVILSHTSATTVEPATLEAAVVMQADGATANAIRSRAYEDLRDAPPAGPHA